MRCLQIHKRRRFNHGLHHHSGRQKCVLRRVHDDRPQRDSGSGHFTAKKFTVFQPQDYPAVYKSVISGVEIPLPGSGLRITAVPNAVEGKGLWAASGVNAANVGMTATETITSNPRVLGADPLVKGGIGEEDIVYLVLPYVRSAREGVRRLAVCWSSTAPTR